MSIALLVAAAACAYVASKSSGEELDGAYRDSARTVLGGATSRFEGSLSPADLDEPSALADKVRELVMVHPEVTSAAIYAPGEAAPVATFGPGTGSRAEAHLAVDAMSSGEQGAGELREGERRYELLATPLEQDGRRRAALVTGQDLQAADEALAERNERVLLVLGVLLARSRCSPRCSSSSGSSAPSAACGWRPRPWARGDLRTRLGWRRRDELGRLARRLRRDGHGPRGEPPPASRSSPTATRSRGSPTTGTSRRRSATSSRRRAATAGRSPSS